MAAIDIDYWRKASDWRRAEVIDEVWHPVPTFAVIEREGHRPNPRKISEKNKTIQEKLVNLWSHI